MAEDGPVCVLYNGACPRCAPEMERYRKAAEAAGQDIRFEDLNGADLASWGLDPDSAARRLHLRRGDEVVSGVDAFAEVWARLPRLRWLAALTRWPIIGGLMRLIYDRVLAPWLYREHRARQRGRAKSA